jgi:hypothetical protein
MPRGLLVTRFALAKHMNFGSFLFLPAKPAYQERVPVTQTRS